MVCPNCKSTDIITVQRENFCISCGHVVTKETSSAAPTIEELAKVQAKVAQSSEMTVLGRDRKSAAPAEPLAPKVADAGAKLRARAKAVGVTIVADAPPLIDAEDSSDDKPPKKPAPAQKSKQKEAPAAAVIIGHAAPMMSPPGSTDDHDDTPLDTAIESPVPELEPAPKVKVAATKPKRRKPGRPKAGRLDVPAAVTAVVSAGEPLQTHSKTITPPSPMTAIVKPLTPAAPRIGAAATPARKITDIRPPAVLDVPTDNPSILPVPENTGATTELSGPIRLDDPPLAMNVLTSASLHERIRPSSFGWALIPATFLALIIGGGAMVLIDGRLDTVVAATQKAGWAIGGELILVMVLYYLSHSLVSAALVVGAARRAAHRPAPLSRQFSVAVNTWPARLGVDLITGSFQLVLIVAIGALIVMGGTPWPLPEPAQLISLFMAFLILSYALAGLILTQNLSRVAVTLGALSPGRGFKLGWDIFRRHFELVGFRILGLLLEIVLLVPFLAAAAGLIVFLPESYRWVSGLGIVLLAAAAGALIGAGTAAWWESAYRHIVERDHADQAIKLLSGRVTEHLQRPTLITTIILATLLVGATIAWPWVTPYLSV